MATLVVHDVPDELYRRLEERARAAGRSIDDEVLQVLTNTVAPASDSRTPAEILDDIGRRRERNPLPPGGPDSVELLREDRSSHEEDAKPSVAEILEYFRTHQTFNPAEHGLPDSTTLLREDRDR